MARGTLETQEHVIEIVEHVYWWTVANSRGPSALDVAAYYEDLSLGYTMQLLFDGLVTGLLLPDLEDPDDSIDEYTEWLPTGTAEELFGPG